MDTAESAIAPREKELFDKMIDCPELVDSVSRSNLPAVINQLAAVVTKAAALQFRIAARLLTETDEQVNGENRRGVVEREIFLCRRCVRVSQDRVVLCADC